MIAWLALVIASIALLLWLVVAYTLRRVWRTVGPQVAPMLAFLSPAPPGREPELDDDEGRGNVELEVDRILDVERCDYRGVEGDRCERRAGHAPPHEWGKLNAELRR